MTPFVEGRHPAEFVLAEANGNRSRDNLKIGASQTILAGTVLGVSAAKAMAAASAVKAGGANTGDGTMTLDANTPILPGAKLGVYTVRCIAAAANGGTFRVENPNGDVIGDVAVGATFADDIKFVIADGAADFVVGDGFDVTVTETDATLAEFGALNLADAAGLAIAVAIALYPATTGAGESVEIAGITRDCTVNGKCLEWPAGITDQQKAAAVSQLAERGIIVR
ncbi:putative phage protein Gp19 [Afipia carboxidovorans OM5]|uniref:Putative phage protein n=1 Tax=Afipia carboxidovorans (strain ATCC 49405 / DSM 1227 / KCTC 32145 / OM5) TaxID=504832 RepID=B6JEE7_AFIC5|nr:head decoration protein [Afipia carboxidovorans]ACI92712.1 putative phage protein Gp19 [Afipia carboxidovorans OM5]AEI03536.1 putative phage protein [Afipia carboxidovorans OM4]AEI07113.1 putative phage protein [Afipia carboxidovorans OM5]